MDKQDISRDVIYNLGKSDWDQVAQHVKGTWPAAKHEGMGYWRIPRVAHIHYSGNNSDGNGWYATLTYRPMGR